MFSNFAQKYSSTIHTFLATFIVTVVTAISVIPADSILSAQTWTTAFIAGILVSAVRAGIKAISPLS